MKMAVSWINGCGETKFGELYLITITTGVFTSHVDYIF